MPRCTEPTLAKGSILNKSSQLLNSAHACKSSRLFAESTPEYFVIKGPSLAAVDEEGLDLSRVDEEK
ncbi:hypothetical protein ACFX2H_022507 [Malus domestica]